jgi:drug/metabolite transporter (DMT)-like permease
MLTIVLGLTAASIYSAWSLGCHTLMRGVSWVLLAAATFGAGVILLIVPALVVDGLPFGPEHLRDLGLAAAGGLLYTASTAAFLLALRVGKLSLVTVLACLDGAFAAAISVALGERVGAVAAAGLVCATAGGLLAAVERRRGADAEAAGGRRRWRFAAGAGLAVVSALTLAVVFVFFGAIDSFSPLTTVTVASLAGLAVVLPVALLRHIVVPPHTRVVTLAGLGALDTLAFLSGTAALALGPVSVASVTQAQTATLSTLLGVAALHERPAWWQLVGIVTTIVGVSLLAWAM